MSTKTHKCLACKVIIPHDSIKGWSGFNKAQPSLLHR